MASAPDNSGKPFEEIGSLVRNLRFRCGMSQQDLAAAAGVTNSYLSRIETGERRPSPRVLRRFAELLQHPFEDLAVISGILSDKFVAEHGASVPSESITRRAVPVYDSIPAGLMKDSNTIAADDDVPKIVLSEEELGYDPRAFALVVTGDSMVEAGILDGDIVIISPATRVGPGDIGAVLINRESTALKKIYVEGDHVMLQPCNSAYKPILLSYPQEVEILGKVILVRRKL